VGLMYGAFYLYLILHLLTILQTETQPYKVKPLATKGLIYLYAEDGECA
jgi:hypothetical protein